MKKIQSLYVTLLARPADVEGMRFYTDLAAKNQEDPAALAVSLNDIASTMASSEEFRARAEQGNRQDTVRVFYRSLFNRDPDPQGLSYFAGPDQNQDAPDRLALRIAGGAQGLDKTIAANKLTVAQHFTGALDTVEKIRAYTADAGRKFLACVGVVASSCKEMGAVLFPSSGTATASDNATATSASGRETEPAIIKTPNAGTTSTGSTEQTEGGLKLTLTPGTDMFSPKPTKASDRTTNGPDTIVGDKPGDLGSGDVLDGGGGEDVLEAVVVDSGTTGPVTIQPVLQSIETAQLGFDAALSDDVTFDAVNTVGMKALRLTGVRMSDSGPGLALKNLDRNTAIEFENLTVDVSKNFENFMADDSDIFENLTVDVSSGIEIEFKDAPGGATGAARLVFSGAGSSLNGSLTLNVRNTDALTLENRGNDIDTAIVLDADKLVKLTVTGDKQVTINNAATTSKVPNLKVDASGLKFIGATDLETAFTYSASGNGETIIGAAGRNNITLGAGKDTVVYNADNLVRSSLSELISDFTPADDTIDLRALNLGDAKIGWIPMSSFDPPFKDRQIVIRVSDDAKQAEVMIDIDKNGEFDPAKDFSFVLVGANLDWITQRYLLLSSDSAATSGGGKPGFLLTSGEDKLAPQHADPSRRTTAGNDTISGPRPGDLGSRDVLHGGEGEDSLEAVLDGTSSGPATISPTLESIEIVQLRLAESVFGSKATFDAVSAKGVKTLKLKDIGSGNPAYKLTLQNIDRKTAVEFENLTFSNASDINKTSNIKVGFRNTTDAAQLVFSGGGGSLSGPLKLSVDDVDRLTLVNRSDAIAREAIVLDAGALKELTVTGDKWVIVNNAAPTSKVSKLKTVDASGIDTRDLKGEVFTYFASDNGETITGTAGRDNITLGAGKDTVVYKKGMVRNGFPDVISKFNGKDDKIDLKDFGLGDVKVGKIPQTQNGTSPIDKDRQICINYGPNNNFADVYIDVDGDKKYSVENDLKIALLGNDLNAITVDNFLL